MADPIKYSFSFATSPGGAWPAIQGSPTDEQNPIGSGNVSSAGVLEKVVSTTSTTGIAHLAALGY